MQKLVNLVDLVKNFQTSIRGHEEDLGLHQVAQAQRGLQDCLLHHSDGFLAALVGFLPISDCNIISQKALSVLNSNDNSILGPHHQARQCAEGGLPRGESAKRVFGRLVDII